MLKVGKLYTVEQTYAVSLYADGGLFERIDIYDKTELMDDYMDTSNASASYIKNKKEYYLGDKEVVQMLLSCRANSSTFCSSTKALQTTEIKDGKFVIRQEKESIDGQYRYILELENGILVYEMYRSPECSLEFEYINKDSFTRPVEPFNLGEYEPVFFYDGTLRNEDDGAEYYSAEYLKAKFDLAHLEGLDHVIIGSMEEADERLDSFIKSRSKIKAVDIEATGLDMYIVGEDELTGVVLSEDEDTSTYFPFMQDAFDYNLPMDYLPKIAEAINGQDEDVLILAHNAQFEKIGFLRYYLDLRLDVCTFVLSVLINPVIRTGLHALGNLAFRVTGNRYLELSDIFKGEVKFNVLPKEIVMLYALSDTPNTIRVYKHLIEALPKDEHGIFWEIEMPLVHVKAENVFYGMRVNMDYLSSALDNEIYKVESLKNIFQGIHSTDKNINSSPVKQNIIYNRLKAPIEVRTKKGAPSVSAEAINRIVDLGALSDKEMEGKETPPGIFDLNGGKEGKPKEIVRGADLISNRYPSLVVLKAYNKAQKERGALVRIMNNTKQGRIKFRINQVGAASGRQTSDAHQYSDGMKQSIVSDTPYHILVDADFRQVELRVLAYLAEQKDLIELQKQSEVDIHRAIGTILSKVPMWAISDEVRNTDKTRNFGVVYMMSEYGLARRNKGPGYSAKDLIEARESITSFYNGLPKIKEFVALNEKLIREDGKIKTRLGRYRYFPEVLDPNITEKEIMSKVRAGNNTPVQGYAADYLKIVERMIYDYIRAKGWDKREIEYNGKMYPYVRCMLSIHDEVMLSVHKEIPMIEVVQMLKECMELEVKNAPPFFASSCYVDNWLQAQDDRYSLPTVFRDQIVEEYERTGKSDVTYDNYLDHIKKFNDTNLKNYMDVLIREHKTVEEVTKHVRHDSLTHTLIQTYVAKGEISSSVPDYHMKRIALATERYMEGYVLDTKAMKEGDIEEADFEAIAGYEDFEKFIDVDDNGKVVEEETNEEDDEDDMEGFFRAFDAELDIAKSTYAYFLMDKVIIDMEEVGIDNEFANGIHAKLSSMDSKDNYYKLVYSYRGRLAETGVLLPFEKASINSIVEEAIECKNKEK